nr:hypothetical protein [Brachyspira hyodysenteriae]
MYIKYSFLVSFFGILLAFIASNFLCLLYLMH